VTLHLVPSGIEPDASTWLASAVRASTCSASVSLPASHLLLRYAHLIEVCCTGPCAGEFINVTISSYGMSCIVGFIHRSLRYGVAHEVRFEVLIKLLGLGMRETFLSKGIL
jgi:hypothetical protein